MSGVVSVYVRSPEEQTKHQRLMRSSSISSSMRRLVSVRSCIFESAVN